MKKNNIQAIVFDAYGTLLDIASIDNQLKEYYGDRSKEIGQLWRNKQLAYTWLRTLMNQYVPFSQITSDALLYAIVSKNLTATDEIVTDILSRYNKIKTYEDVIHTLGALSAKFQLAVLSNADHKMLSPVLAFNNTTNLFDKILSADTIKKFKPHVEVYQLAVDELEIAKENILFISSNTWDVAGAKSFGFSVFWINRKNTVIENLGVGPDKTIQQLSDLSDFLLP